MVTTHSYITMTNNINTKSPEPPVKTSSQEHDTVTEYGYITSTGNTETESREPPLKTLLQEHDAITASDVPPKSAGSIETEP